MTRPYPASLTPRLTPPARSAPPAPPRQRPPDDEELLTPREVAALFRVDPKTVTRWAQAGKLSCIRTLGRHRRFRAAEVYALRNSGFRGGAE